MNVASPLVDLRIDIEQCPYIVYVNGGSVSENKSAGPAHESSAINHFLRSGENEISVVLFAEDLPQCDAKVAVTVSDANDESAKAATALTLAYAPAGMSERRTSGSSPAGRFDTFHGYKQSDRGDLTVGPVQVKEHQGDGFKIFIFSRTFSLHLPFPEWAFFKGEKMRPAWEFPAEDEIAPSYKQILTAYDALNAMLAKKDVNQFLDACEERSREIDIAYYKTPGATRARLRQDLDAAINDSRYKLKPVVKSDGKFWTYNVGSTGRLIGLTAGSRGSAILRFKSEESSLDLVFPVFFRKEGARFIVTR